jgi:hypothetical protein
MYFALIFSAGALLVALPRTLDGISYLGLVSAALILLCGIVAMVGAGINPLEGRTISATKSSDFFTAFTAITNPVSIVYLRDCSQ